MTLSALAAVVLRPSWRVAACWLICLAILATIGLLGRPGIGRVYFPLLALLIVAPLVNPAMRLPVPQLVVSRITTAVLAVLACFAAFGQFEKSQAFELAAAKVRADFAAFPREPVVIWGDAFPFEMMYPVLNTSASRPLQLYGLGVSTLAPFSTAYAEQRNNRGITDLFQKPSGVPFLAVDSQYDLLEIYCREHFQGKLLEVSRRSVGNQIVSYRRCQVTASPSLPAPK